MESLVLTRFPLAAALCAALSLGGVCVARANESATEASHPPEFSPQQLEFFESKIRPLLDAHCYECHGDEVQEGGLRLDSRAALVAGGDSGAAVEAGQP